jgi:hypothetical protein
VTSRSTPGRALASAAALAGFAALGACSLAIDLGPLKDGICPAGEKACEDRCVLLGDPNYGCASVGCAPCTLPNAVAICTPEGACALGACIGNYRDCDNNPAEGCETDTDHDPQHCGGCMAALCTTANGTPGCADGRCSTGACNPGFGDCDMNPANGCETDVYTSAANCGECRNMCLSGQTCKSGSCTP